jgi:hypothetical protein
MLLAGAEEAAKEATEWHHLERPFELVEEARKPRQLPRGRWFMPRKKARASRSSRPRRPAASVPSRCHSNGSRAFMSAEALPPSRFIDRFSKLSSQKVKQ